MAPRIDAQENGAIRVMLSAREHDLLRSLPEQLRPVLTGEQDVAESHARLFPPAYDDPDADADYHEMMDAELAEERLAALETFAATLEEGREHGGAWEVELDLDQVEAWLSATNSARLVLAMIVGITSEEDWDHAPTPEDPAAVALWYLGWLQEELLAALTGSEPDPGQHVTE